MKFTPGPWIVENIDCESGFWVKQPGLAGFSIAAIIGQKEQEDNARLIAAAPEMFDLLQDLRAIYNPDLERFKSLMKKLEGR